MAKAPFFTEVWSLVLFTKKNRSDIDKGFYVIMGNQNSTPNMHNLGLRFEGADGLPAIPAGRSHFY